MKVLDRLIVLEGAIEDTYLSPETALSDWHFGTTKAGPQ